VVTSGRVKTIVNNSTAHRHRQLIHCLPKWANWWR